MKQLTPNASYSRVTYYNNCPRAYKFKYIDKLVEPARPQLLDSQGKPRKHQGEIGSHVHKLLEEFILDTTATMKDLPQELSPLRMEIMEVKDTQLQEINGSPEAKVYAEDKWYFDKDWNSIPTPTKENPGYYAMVIIDCMVFPEIDTGFKARVIDLKTGKRYGNELKHQRQTQLYALAAFHKFPKLIEITTELWYRDLGLVHKKAYSREQILSQQRYWDGLIEDMRDDETFVPKANQSSCMFCPWGKKEHSNKWVNKSGDCQDSVPKQFKN